MLHTTALSALKDILLAIKCAASDNVLSPVLGGGVCGYENQHHYYLIVAHEAIIMVIKEQSAHVCTLLPKSLCKQLPRFS